MIALRHCLHDGGRSAAGFRGDAGDCVTRAIAIGTGLPYSQVYRELYERAKGDLEALNQLNPPRPAPNHPGSPRTGIPRPIYEPYLRELGWEWTATMRPGQGCKVHLRADELPDAGFSVVSASTSRSFVTASSMTRTTRRATVAGAFTATTSRRLTRRKSLLRRSRSFSHHPGVAVRLGSVPA